MSLLSFCKSSFKVTTSACFVHVYCVLSLSLAAATTTQFPLMSQTTASAIAMQRVYGEMLSLVTCEECACDVSYLLFRPPRPPHALQRVYYVSKNAAGKVRAVLEGVGLDSAAISACIASNPNDDKRAAQVGLTRWKEGQGQQPPSWACTVLFEAMEYELITQQHACARSEGGTWAE